MNVIDQVHRPRWSLYNGDCVEVIRALPNKSVDLSLFSPPFSSLYTYSPSERDMGNAEDDADFCRHYAYLAEELYRITRPGRLCAVHCKEIADYKIRAGRAGLRDFPGDLIRVHEDTGWKYHSRVTIWKCPVQEAARTNTQRLLYGQMQKDSTLSGVGQSESILIFRRWPTADEEAELVPVVHVEGDIPLRVWRDWASPVWLDINQTRVLNVAEAKSDKDEKHMCPLQLDVVERIVRLYSNHGEVVFSPFTGIGSEGDGALRFGRRFAGVELKPEYFKKACENLEAATRQLSMDLAA